MEVPQAAGSAIAWSLPAASTGKARPASGHTHNKHKHKHKHARRNIQQLRVVQFITISCVAKTACQMVNLTIVNVCRRLVAGLRWSKS